MQRGIYPWIAAAIKRAANSGSTGRQRQMPRYNVTMALEA